MTISLSSLSADWPAIEALLDEALDLPSAERAAWLDGLTDDRASHRETLRTLLARQASIESDRFLVDGPTLEPLAETPATLLAEGTTIGAYRLVSQIGQGGMGTVWLAERSDGLMQRRVALKLPRIVWGDAFAERLGRERNILARLEHEHIARLYDGGIDAQGRPFLAMEYVEGQPIDVHCRGRALPIRERIVLLLQVTAAVAHAHARLVVHRDLKPGNILVTAEGRVRLLDFGIAKLLEGDRTRATALTELSGRALTLDYASPEQVRGEPLGTASDVYSLGVVAYELLADARPYRLKRGTAAEMEEAIAGVERRLASDAAEAPATKKALRGDLDAILHRALKKEVADRYPSVEALAQDLERYLRGAPVHARPDSRGYRLAKFVRRNGLAVAMTSALIVSLLGGSAVALWQARLAREREAQAEAEVTRQASVRDLYVEAMGRLSVLRGDKPEAVDGVTVALQDVLRAMAPRYKDRPDARDAQLEAVMVQLNENNQIDASLAVGQEYLEGLKAHHAPASRIIDAYTMLGRNLGSLGRLDESEAALRTGWSWSPDTHDVRTERSRLELAADLDTTLIARGKRKEAEAVLTHTEDVAARLFPNDAGRFQNLMQLSIFWWVFDDVRSLQYARRAHAGVVAAGTADPADQALDFWYLGAAQADNGLAPEAEASSRDMLAIYERLEGQGSVKSVRSIGRVASALARQGQYARAAALLSDEVQTLSRLPGGLPVFAARELQARRRENTWLSGDVQAAAAALATDAPLMLASDNFFKVELPLVWQIRALSLVGREREALSLLMAWEKTAPEPGRPTKSWLQMLELQATLELATGDAGQARRTARGLLAMLAEHRGTAGRAHRVAAELAALAAARLGDRADAARSLALADAAAQPPPFPSNVERAESELRRAEILSALGRGADAASAAQSALADLAAQHPDSPRLARARGNAGPEARVSER